MLRRFALSIAVLLSLAVTAQAASMITTASGNVITLQENMAGQQVEFFVNSPDNDQWQGLAFRAWIEDGGTLGALLGVGAGSDLAGPNMTDVDVITGTIFASNTTGPQDILEFPLAWEEGTTTASGHVTANGLLATVTFDTTGIAPGTYQMFLDGVASIGGAPVGFAPTDHAGSRFPEGPSGSAVDLPTIPDVFTLEVEGEIIDPPFPGDSPTNPILPDNDSPPWLFTDVGGSEGSNPDGSTGLWFDPIVTDGYIYETDGTSNFTQVGLPPLSVVADADGNYLVTRGDGGGSLIVPAGGFWNFDGVPQTEFSITGINPAVDGEDPTAFPTFLVFDELSNTFTMTPIPEPSSLALAGLGVLGLIGYGLRRRSA